MTRMTKQEKYEMLLKIQELRKEDMPWREIGPKLGQAESWASVFWQRNQDLLENPPEKPQPKMSTKPPEVVDLPDSQPKPAPRPTRAAKTLTYEDLRIAFQVFLHENQEDPDVKHIRPKVSKSWGGTLEGGGGWSGAIMKTLQIVAKMGVKK